MKNLLKEMHTWLDEYIKSFYRDYKDDEEILRGIRLKEIHTGYVTDNSLKLARELALDDDDVFLAEYIGLFHDVGRFPQYARYKTFSDADTQDHSELGLTVMLEHRLLDRLASGDADIVKFAISNHNKREIEPIYSHNEDDRERKLLFAKIIRDADKLDIYRVLLPFLTPEGRKEAPKFLNTETSELVSEEFIRDFALGKQADYYRMRTHGDRKIVRLMWLYDINFTWTLKEIVTRGYMQAFIDSLEPQAGLKEGLDRLVEYVNSRIFDKYSIAINLEGDKFYGRGN